MKCPDIRDPEVAKKIRIVTEILNENIAINDWIANNGHGFDEGPLGRPSLLHKRLSEAYDRDYGIVLKSSIYEDEFKHNFGDWINEISSTEVTSRKKIDEEIKVENIVTNKEAKEAIDNHFENSLEDLSSIKFNDEDIALDNKLKTVFKKLYPEIGLDYSSEPISYKRALELANNDALITSDLVNIYEDIKESINNISNEISNEYLKYERDFELIDKLENNKSELIKVMDNILNTYSNVEKNNQANRYVFPKEINDTIDYVLGEEFQGYKEALKNDIDALPLIINLTNKYAKTKNSNWYNVKNKLLEHLILNGDNIWTRDGIIYAETPQGQVSFHVFGYEPILAAVFGVDNTGRKWSGIPTQMIADDLLRAYIKDNGIRKYAEPALNLEKTIDEDIEEALKNTKKLRNLMFQRKNNKIKGVTNIKALSILLDSFNRDLDTLPHEYAHVYIAWYRNTKLVKDAIDKWGSEEALVQAIGEQVINQKGEANNWWKVFWDFIRNKLSSSSKETKDNLKGLLTDALLNKIDLNSNKINLLLDSNNEPASYKDGRSIFTIGRNGNRILFEPTQELDEAHNEKNLTPDDEWSVASELEELASKTSTNDFVKRITGYDIYQIGKLNPKYNTWQLKAVMEYIKDMKIIEFRLKEYGFELLNEIAVKDGRILHYVKAGNDIISITEGFGNDEFGFKTEDEQTNINHENILDIFNSVHASSNTFFSNGPFMTIENAHNIGTLFNSKVLSHDEVVERDARPFDNNFIPKLNKRALNHIQSYSQSQLKAYMDNSYMKNAELFASMIKKMFPQLKIHVYNSNDIENASDKLNADGFVAEDGTIFLNGRFFNPKTALHEFGHILEPILKQANNPVYNQIMSIIEKEISGDGQIHRLSEIIKDKYKKIGEPLSWNKLKSEIFAETLAFVNEKNAENFLLLSNNFNDEEFVRDMKAYGMMIFNTINNTFEADSIENLFIKLNSDIQSFAKNGFSYSQIDYLKTYFKDNGSFYRMQYEGVKDTHTEINGIGDIHKALIGNEYVAYSSQELAKNIIKTMKSRALYSPTYKYYYNDKNYTYSKSLSETELIRRVMDDVAEDKFKAIHSKKDKIISAINKVGKSNDITTSIKEAIGNGATNLSANKLINFMGLNKGVRKVYKLSEIKGLGFKEFGDFGNINLGDFDPMVIIHSLDEEHVDLSFVDVTYDNINPNQMILEDNNIFSKYMSTSEYFDKTGNLRMHNRMKLRNTDVDIKNFQLGLLALHAQQTLGSKFHLRKLGTVHTNASDTKAKMVLDLKGLINNITIASNSKEFMEKITDENTKKLINSAINYNDNIKQSFMSQLMTYLDIADNGGLKDPFLHYSYRQNMRALFTNDMSIKRKIELIDSIKRYIINKNDENYIPDVYYILSGLSRELRTGEIGTPDDVENMSALAVSLTAAGNVRNAYLQDVVEAVQKAKTNIIDEVVKDINHFIGTKNKPGLFSKVYNKRIKKHPELLLESLAADRGSAIFEHLYKRSVVNIVKEGKVVGKKEVKLLKLHNNASDSETKKLLANGTLTLDDIAFSKEILLKQKEAWVDKMLAEDKKRQQNGDPFIFGKLTKAEAEKMYDNAFDSDDIVVFGKSVNELFLSGKFKEAYTKYKNEAISNDFIMEDMVTSDITSDNSLTRMNDYFGNQFDKIKRLNKAGLDLDENGNYILKDENLNEFMSTDVWKIHNYFNQSLVRKKIYERDVLPVAKDSITLLKQLEEMGKSQSETIRYIKEYIDGNAFRKNQDDDKSVSIPLIGEVKVSETMRMLTKVYSTAVLPFKLGIGIFSMIFNMNRVLTESLASTISGNEHIMPKLKYFLQAGKMMFTDFKKVKTLSKDMQLWDSDERDMTSSPFRNPVNKKIYDEAFMNILNWATDTFTRSLAMVAVLKREGSYEAYGYDEESGEVTYDETKDKKWYNSDGTLKEESKDEFLLLKSQLEEKGLVKNGKLLRGFSDVDTHNMKYIADKYLIGSFSPETRAMIGNRWLGKISGQFRLFSIDRLNNAGMFGNTYSTKLGGKEKAVTLEDGTIVSRRERREMESMLESVKASWDSIVKFGNYTPREFSKWYNEQTPERKFNLAKTFIQLTMFAIMASLSSALRDDKDKNKKMDRQFSKFIGDILIMGTIGDFIRSPFPSIDALVRFMNGSNLTQFVPLSGAVKEYSEILSKEEEEKQSKE